MTMAAPVGPGGHASSVHDTAASSRPQQHLQQLDAAFVAARRGGVLESWELRQPRAPVGRLDVGAGDQRRMCVSTDPSGRFVVSGSQDLSRGIAVFDLQAPLADDSAADTLIYRPNITISRPHGETPACAVAVHPYFSSALPVLATAGGGRQYVFSGDDDESDGLSEENNTLKMWMLE
jgi:hypothetical protein